MVFTNSSSLLDYLSAQAAQDIFDEVDIQFLTMVNARSASPEDRGRAYIDALFDVKGKRLLERVEHWIRIQLSVGCTPFPNPALRERVEQKSRQR